MLYPEPSAQYKPQALGVLVAYNFFDPAETLQILPRW
jgi:hypothetical protein